MGPMIIFDKSFLQSLTVDEAVILDQMFSCVVTPLFFVETMADLTKETARGRSAEQVVGGLAERTPVAHSYINTYHQDVVLEDLLGRREEFDHRPAVAGGIPVKVEGKAGLVFRKSPEQDAFDRWQQGRFLEVERVFARQWRDELANIDLPSITKAWKSILRSEDRPKTHEAARDLARRAVDAGGQNYRILRMAHNLLGMPPRTLNAVVRNWKAAGSLPLREYAPLAAHCLEVDLFFELCLSNGLISDQRPSNKIDISYLYYLPFADFFVSGDKLHRTAAPLFMDARQRFVWGQDLKADLAALNSYFSTLPDEEKAKGLFTLASKPPIDHNGLVADLWDVRMPGWRTPKPPAPKMAPKAEAEIIARSRGLVDAASRSGPYSWDDGADVEHLVIERHIPKQRGSWRMFSAAVEASNDADGRNSLADQ
ncbi:hypothetical protein SKP52_16935 [Sphingopyxis fribergensis]|uniref:Uncharacterized protein n=2 Tax=Sphingopyxis fribergensis TaxID=1515612 RepID=A0A0A7PJW6_9SPHN|nr:hypothetical protein SKP52_16935 [Sphingopyxis fribergensis]